MNREEERSPQGRPVETSTSTGTTSLAGVGAGTSIVRRYCDDITVRSASVTTVDITTGFTQAVVHTEDTNITGVPGEQEEVQQASE
jgi:hypothetical protein